MLLDPCFEAIDVGVIDARKLKLRLSVPSDLRVMSKHKTMKLDIAKHILDIDGIAVGALIGAIQDVTAT